MALRENPGVGRSFRGDQQDDRLSVGNFDDDGAGLFCGLCDGRRVQLRGVSGAVLGIHGPESIDPVAAQLLAQALREKGSGKLPPLALHALTSGFDARAPEKAPDAFCGYFQNIGHDVEMFGLFGPPLVRANEFKKAR